MDNLQLGVALLGFCIVSNLLVTRWIVQRLRKHELAIEQLWRETWAARQ